MPADDGKLKVSIILIADHFTSEYLPFHIFATQSGLYSSLNIGPIEYYSWNSFEYMFSLTSVSKFEEKINKKWENASDMTVEDSFGFDLEKSTPAHKYEYFKDIAGEIFSNNIT